MSINELQGQITRLKHELEDARAEVYRLASLARLVMGGLAKHEWLDEGDECIFCRAHRGNDNHGVPSHENHADDCLFVISVRCRP